MRLFYSVLILFPVLALSQNCPTFQSVIALKPSVTSLNFSYAIVAEGHYYLVPLQDINRNNIEPMGGDLPKGFEESRLITVVDKSDCNESEYYLIAIKSFRSGVDSVQTSYSSLDLIGWDLKTKWSEPKPLSEHPLFASDPYLKLFNQIDPNVEIEDLIHSVFYWEQTRTYIVVTKPLQRGPSEPIPSSTLRYYSVDAQRSCDQIYSYSKSLESLSTALNSVVEPLDFCFFSHYTGLGDQLLYCLGRQSFQVNSIVTQFKNGSIRSEIVGIPQQLPKIDRLRLFGKFCKQSPEKTSKEVEEFAERDRIRVRIDEIRIGVVEPQEDPMEGFKPEGRANVAVKEPEMPSVKRVESSSPSVVPEDEDSSSTFIIVLICLAIFVLIMIGILVIAARRQQQMAKM